MSIRPLPPEAVAQIKSSITLTSLNGVVCELLKNSLDALSTKVEITLDYSLGSCTVEDNGLGILPSEFGESGNLGKLYHSSKLSRQPLAHGARGMFIASLSAMSLLSIDSRHHEYHSRNTIAMYKSTIVSRQTPAHHQHPLASFNHGTRVTVRNLFGNMPVRVKQRASTAERQHGHRREWEELRRDVVLLLLAWPKSVTLTIQETGTNDKIGIRGKLLSTSSSEADPATVSTLLSQASVISFEDKSFWVSARASTQNIVIDAAVSLLPSATKHSQFISFGIRPLVSHGSKGRLHDEINHMFRNSAFGNDEELVELDAPERGTQTANRRYRGEGYTSKELKGGKKGIERWPMFYINIQQAFHSIDGKYGDIEDVLDDRGNDLSSIVELLQALIWEFLMKHHFRPKILRGMRSKQSADGAENVSPERPTAKSLAKPVPSIQQHRLPDNVTQLSPLDKCRETGVTNMNRASSYPVPRKIDTPFDSWTRIKRGSRPVIFSFSDKDYDSTGQNCDISRPFSAPSSSTTEALTSKSTLCHRSSTPLISSNGKIIRCPFDDMAPQVATLRQDLLSPPLSDPSNGINASLVKWINPVTKVESLVDQRTGLTVRSHNSNTSDSMSPAASSIFGRNRQRLKQNIIPNRVQPSPWLHNILTTWNNPVFPPVEESVPQVSFSGGEAGVGEKLHSCHHRWSQLDIDKAYKGSSSDIDGRISRVALISAEVVSQVDNKFILVKLQGAAGAEEGKMLVLIDQHAADERVRIESLWTQFFIPPSNDTMPTGCGISTELLDKPATFEISPKEYELLDKYREHFSSWGIIYDLPKYNTQASKISIRNTLPQITVRYLPRGIIERCKIDPQLLIDLIRSEAWKVNEGEAKIPATEGDWLERLLNCPQGIIDMLNSRACRSAIMFNDELNMEQCETLVRRLARCKLPFQCAHGRPSLVPLVDLGRTEMRASRSDASLKRSEDTFGAAFNRWRSSVDEVLVGNSLNKQ